MVLTVIIGFKPSVAILILLESFLQSMTVFQKKAAIKVAILILLESFLQ